MVAIGEQILGPTDVSLSNWTVRPSSGCSVVLPTHTAGVSVDGYTLTLAVNLWNINLTPGRELLFACRYRLGTTSNFVVQQTTSTTPCTAALWATRLPAKMYFTMPPNGVAKLHFGAHFQAPGLPNQTAGTVDVYGLQILDATLDKARVPRRRGRRRHAGHPGQGAAGAHAHHARQFSGALSFFQLEGYAMTLSAFA